MPPGQCVLHRLGSIKNTRLPVFAYLQECEKRDVHGGGGEIWQRMNQKSEISKKNIVKHQIDNKHNYTIDFVTSSAISKIGYKFLALYIPILWFSGYMTVAVFFDVSRYIPWYINMFLLPVWLFILYFIEIVSFFLTPPEDLTSAEAQVAALATELSREQQARRAERWERAGMFLF